MALNFGNIMFLGHFNPKTDKWCDYKERLLCALDAAGVEDDAKARSLFLSQCGKDTYSLIASLVVPQRPTTVVFRDILEVLDTFYKPETNEILEAGRFHKRLQLQSESVQDFVAAINELGAKCNFVDLKRQLRDRLVLGIQDDRLRRDLLKTKQLTYEAAVQICLNYQATFSDLYPQTSRSRQTPGGSVEPMEIDRIKTVGCQHCARQHKPGERCTFTKARCYYCKKFGHIVAACDKRDTKMHKIEETVSEDTQSSQIKENMMGIYNCSETYYSPIKVDIIINGAKLSMEIDSGASRSIISEETYKMLWMRPPPLMTTNIKLVTWTRDPLKVLGLLHVHASLGNKEAQCELIVVSGKGPSLLGRNWFHNLGIQVDGIGWTSEMIESLKVEYPEVFKEGLGEYKGPEVSLHLRSNATPRFLKARPVPFPLKHQVEEELTHMIESGILTPVKYSQWATPLRIVKKDNGSLRICGDYRSTVNSAIEVDQYPLPTSMEAFVKLSGGRVFSKLDLKQAYTQVKVDKQTAQILTLNTHIGLMQVNRLAFGISAAPAIFQRLMSTAFAQIEGVACLLDDIAIAGRTQEEHNQRLHMVLSKIQELGFRLNLQKCIFASNCIHFLGHMIDGEGLHPSPLKVKEILEKPAPTNKETLQAFLGLYNYYEKFLPDKATILEPLYRLLESKKPWSWGKKEEAAFVKAKSLLGSDATLVGYELDRELLLICDSSEYGLGAIIAHVMDDGSERPIMMASRTLQKHERNYGQIDKEALAIIFGITKFHQFLAGRHFCIVTDHKPLVGLFSPNKPIPDLISPRMLRWSIKLSCYDYSIKYRPGKLINNADALSRWTALETSTLKSECIKEVLLLEDQPAGWNLDSAKIAEETRKDKLLQRVMFFVLHGWPNTNPDSSLQHFWMRKEALSHNKGCLLWGNRVVIPESLQDQVLRLLHEPHAGIVLTKAYARGYVWWNGMDRAIERTVRECELCQTVRNNPPRNPLAWIIPEKPWSRIHIDFAGPYEGKTFLVLIDSYSKWPEAEIVQSPSSKCAITTLRKIFASQGLPEVVVSDNGRAFVSEEFNTFLQKNNIKHVYSPPYHPATNGQAEVLVKVMKNKLKKLAESDMQWSEKLAKALYWLRTVPNTTTNKTPAEMLNGRRYRTAISVIHPDSAPSSRDLQLQDLTQQVPKRLFKIKQPVLIRMYGSGEKWCKAVVESVDGPCSYTVKTDDGQLYRRHVDQIIARSISLPQESNDSCSNGSERSYTSQAPEIEIPDPVLWPDIIGVPMNDDVQLNSVQIYH